MFCRQRLCNHGVVAAAGDAEQCEEADQHQQRRVLQRRSAIYLDASAGLGVMGRRNETVTAEMTNSPAMTVKAV